MRFGSFLIAVGVLLLVEWELDPFRSWLFLTTGLVVCLGGFGFMVLSRLKTR